MKRLSIGACLLAGLTATPGAWADNKLVLELLGPGADSFMFGRYNGLEQDKAYLNADLYWSGEEEARKWSLEATNLGLDGRSVRYRLQTSSSLDFSASYVEVSQRDNDTGLTPFSGSGYLQLPVAWTPAATVTGFDDGLIARDFKRDSLRKTLSINLSGPVSSALSLAGDIAFVERTGTRLTGAAIYTNAANPQAVHLPEEIDHRILKADVTANIDLDKVALTTTASMVQFRNRQSLTRWQNPYMSGLGANVDFPAGVGGIVGEPDYDQYALSMTGSWRIRPAIQLVAGGAESRTEQDAGLTQYTVNPLLSIVSGLPATSLDGRLETRRLNLFLLTRPFRGASLNFRYRHKARENTASRLAWNAVIGDGTDQPDAAFSIFNRPLEKESDIYSIDAGFRLKTGQKIKASYRFVEDYRNYASVKDSEVESWRMALSSGNTGSIQHRVEAIVEDHAGSTYEWSRSFFQTLAVDLINQVPDDQRWSNHPLLRQYHLANHEGTTFKWRTSWQPAARWHVDFEAQKRDVEFDRSELGLTDTSQQSAQVNVSHATDGYEAWAWFGWEVDQRDQVGRDFSGGIQKPANRIAAPLPQGSDSARNYGVAQATEAFSLGLGMRWQVSERLGFNMEYTGISAREENEFDVYGARDLVGSDLPSVRYQLHRLDTSVDWQVRAGLVLTATHGYFRYEDDNFAWPALEAGDPLKLLTSRQLAPNEVVNFFSIAVSYAFDR